MSADSNLRFGIIGAGRIGRIHADNLALHLPGARVAAVFDPDPEAADACARRCGAARAVSDNVGRLADDSTLDAVVICSPTTAHAEQIEQFAAAGKQIFCEKPIHLDLARIDQVLAAVRSAGVRLMVGFNRRFDPGFSRARETVASGRIGTPHLVRVTSRDPGPPPASYIRQSGGLFLDMTIHDLDMARWIIGDEVSRIFALAGVLVDPAIGELGDVDTAVLSLGYRGGALGTIDNSRKAAYGYDQRLEVLGSEGAVVVGNVPPTTATIHTPQGVLGDGPLHFFLERYEAAYRAEMAEFVACLREDRAPSVTGEDGRAPVVMALAARRSLAEGRMVEVEG